MLRRFPFRGFPRFVPGEFRVERSCRGETDKVSVSYCFHASDGLRRSEINLLQLRAIRRGTQHFAIKHSRPPDVRRIPMSAGDDLVGADTRDGRPKDAPLLRFEEADAGCDFALERLGMLLTREVRIAELLTRAESFHITIVNRESLRVGVKRSGGGVDQQLARGRASPPNRRD